MEPKLFFKLHCMLWSPNEICKLAKRHRNKCPMLPIINYIYSYLQLHDRVAKIPVKQIPQELKRFGSLIVRWIVLSLFNEILALSFMTGSSCPGVLPENQASPWACHCGVAETRLIKHLITHYSSHCILIVLAYGCSGTNLQYFLALLMKI